MPLCKYVLHLCRQFKKLRGIPSKVKKDYLLHIVIKNYVLCAFCVVLLRILSWVLSYQKNVTLFFVMTDLLHTPGY